MLERKDTIDRYEFIRPPELRAILQTLKRILDAENFGFEPVPSRRGIEYGFVGSDTSSAYAGRAYRVVPLLRTWTYDYWLAVVVRYVLSGGIPVLDAVGITVFRGDRTDDQKLPLFRVEWDCPSGTAQGRHAQPHWHVYNATVEHAPELDGLSSGAPLLDFGATQALQEPNKAGGHADFARFHFALAARWHLRDANAHLTQPDAAALPSWVGECVMYIAQQLEYLAEKAIA